jgi:hypothetical protein
MRPRRRISIADVMLIVPAAAIATLLLRHYMPGFNLQLAYIPTIAPDPYGLWRAHYWLHGPGSCLVVPWMAATIAIRLRRPRPRLIRYQPGFVACVAVMVSLLPGLAWILTIRHRPGFQKPGSFEQVWAITTHWTETAVVGAWIALLLSRKWRPEPSWIDRMGRGLGFYWIIQLFALLALNWMQAIRNSLAGWTP